MSHVSIEEYIVQFNTVVVLELVHYSPLQLSCTVRAGGKRVLTAGATIRKVRRRFRG